MFTLEIRLQLVDTPHPELIIKYRLNFDYITFTPTVNLHPFRLYLTKFVKRYAVCMASNTTEEKKEGH